MVYQVFSVFDVKSALFSQPFFSNNNLSAIRAFSDSVSDSQSTISKHPEDYRLYCLGEYNDNSGGLLPKPQPEFLVNASDFVKSVV